LAIVCFYILDELEAVG